MRPAFCSMLTCKRTGFVRGLVPVSHFVSLTWSHFILGGDCSFLFLRGTVLVTKVPEIPQVTKGGIQV